MKLIDILKEYNIPIGPMNHYHCRENWVNIDCPYCSHDTQGWYMGINFQYNYVSCWRCGSHPLINTMMLLTKLSYYEVKKLLDDLDIEHFEKHKPTGKLVIPTGIKKLRSAHIYYLETRGFNWREIERVWKIKGIGISNRLSWRIWIPIHHHGEIVSWTTRSISHNPKIARYISASETEELLPHKQLLYGEDFARHAIIVNEGPINAWRIGPGAVATFGVGYSIEQLERMSKYPIRAICFDNELEAQKRARKLVNDLSVFPGETYNIELDAKDAAEESNKNIKRLRKEILE